MHRKVFIGLFIVCTSLLNCRKERFGEYHRLVGNWRCVRIESLELDTMTQMIDTNVVFTDNDLQMQLTFLERGRMRLKKDGEKISATAVMSWTQHVSDLDREVIFELDFHNVPEGLISKYIILSFDLNERSFFQMSEGYLDVINECDYAGSHGLNYVFVKE